MSSTSDQLVTLAAKGNADAEAFLVGWHRYCHLIDDIVDGDAGPRAAIQVARWANDLYGTPFYRAHEAALRPLVQLVTCAYDDSVDMATSPAVWERREADVIRHCGADMVRMVAWLVGGYEHMRSISRDLRSICYHEHHDAGGNPK